MQQSLALDGLVIGRSLRGDVAPLKFLRCASGLLSSRGMLKVALDDTTNVDVNKPRDAYRVAESVAFSQQLSSGVWVVPIVHLGKPWHRTPMGDAVE